MFFSYSPYASASPSRSAGVSQSPAGVCAGSLASSTNLAADSVFRKIFAAAAVVLARKTPLETAELNALSNPWPSLVANTLSARRSATATDFG